MNGRAWTFRAALPCRRGKKETLEAFTLPSNVNLIVVKSRLRGSCGGGRIKTVKYSSYAPWMIHKAHILQRKSYNREAKNTMYV
jgi:hypothetical protein